MFIKQKKVKSFGESGISAFLHVHFSFSPNFHLWATVSNDLGFSPLAGGGGDNEMVPLHVKYSGQASDEGLAA